MVYRVYVEKKKELANEAKSLFNDIKTFLGIDGITDVRLVNCYDAENIDEELFNYCKKTVFSEPQLDIATESVDFGNAVVFAVEYLPGQFDQRADSAAQCIQLISQQDRPLIRTMKVYALYGNLSAEDIEKIKNQNIKGIEAISGAELTDEAEVLKIQTIYGEKTCTYQSAMLERCHVCKGKEHKIYDEIIGESKETKDAERFAEVEKIEAMSPEEKFAFFQGELSKCIRCNACRNVCPACSCRKCVFDSTKFDSAQKANVDSFEEKMFHIIRAFHVAG